MTTREAIDLLATLDPDAILWHSFRYDSADRYRSLIVAARGDGAWLATGDHLRTGIATIAEACTWDGADRGFIPCLGSAHRAVWDRLYADYGR